MSKEFYFKQYNLASVRSFDVKTILFEAVQFSIIMQMKYQKSSISTRSL